MSRGCHPPRTRSAHSLWLLLAAALATARWCCASGLADKVIWAINAGGEAHTDIHGVYFRRDPLEGKVGRASDYGMRLPILRSAPEDQILYQTERYNEESFGYEVQIKEEGDYVLVLKFAEVYFAQSQQKVFDVRLNGQHVVVKDLDIFEKVGHSTAHDELVPFIVRKGKLSVQGEVSTFNGKLLVEFVKGYYDNPKVCAVCIMKGLVDEFPKLLPHPGLEKKEEEEEEEDYEEGSEKKPPSKKKVKSGPRTPDPYASDNSSLMFPILVAFGVFIPTLFCLCRL
ncbi:malectin isoform X1 [Callorhinchus milii]|nr:malectin isoform X1 [Callorhinchus milii]XP_042193403.1 malectin isoform X1 [Callorhinchus milii]